MLGSSGACVEPTDATVVARAGEGDPDALGILYRRFAAPLMRLAYHVTGAQDDAQDVLHDVFLGLPEALRRYEERGSLEAWLKRVTTRVALTRLRRRDGRREVPLPTSGEPAIGSDEACVTRRLLLAQALRSLPDSLRAVFVLKEIEGYTHQEIGTVLGIGIGTSQVRLHRAIKHLRKQLGTQP